jgi:hypothetical protein
MEHPGGLGWKKATEGMRGNGDRDRDEHPEATTREIAVGRQSCPRSAVGAMQNEVRKGNDECDMRNPAGRSRIPSI